MTEELVFVYGTLMQGLPAHERMAGAEFLGTGSIKGDLINLGTFPAALEEGEGTIQGEVYRVSTAQLASLDRYEGCYSESPHSLYVRVRVKVEQNDRVDTAWVYFYNRALDPEFDSLIPSGDYRQYYLGAGGAQ